MSIDAATFTATMRQFAATGATIPELIEELRRTAALPGLNDHEDRVAVIAARKASAADAMIVDGEIVRRGGWTVWTLP